MTEENQVVEKKFTLRELVEFSKKVETGEEVSEDVQELSIVATQLLKGKVDDAAKYKAGLEAHIEALTEQLQYHRQLLERTEELMLEAVELSGKTKLEGMAWSIARQKNSRDSVTIADENLIPNEYKKVSLSLSGDYSDDLYRFYCGVVLGRVFDGQATEEETEKLKKAVKMSVSKTAVEGAVKEGKTFDGVTVERGYHLRVRKGKVQPKALEG